MLQCSLPLKYLFSACDKPDPLPGNRNKAIERKDNACLEQQSMEVGMGTPLKKMKGIERDPVGLREKGSSNTETQVLKRAYVESLGKNVLDRKFLEVPSMTNTVTECRVTTDTPTNQVGRPVFDEPIEKSKTDHEKHKAGIFSPV